MIDEPSRSSATQHRIAIWKPAWYELDQTLVVGQWNEMFFFEALPAWALEYQARHSQMPPIELAFFNQVSSEGKVRQASGTITELYHFDLGFLSMVDTHGLDYIFFPLTGEELVVDAEESPGQISQGNSERDAISDWAVRVTIADLEFVPENKMLWSNERPSA